MSIIVKDFWKCRGRYSKRGMKDAEKEVEEHGGTVVAGPALNDREDVGTAGEREGDGER